MPAPISVLIVDDSQEDRSIAHWHLDADELGRFTIGEASSGAAGLRSLKEHMPDCVLLDHHLNDMDALRFMDGMAAPGAPLPCAVVVLTGQGDENLARQCLQRGAEDHLVKTLDMHVSLGRVLRSAVRRYRVAQERDKAAQSQQVSETRFRTLAELLPGFVFITDADGQTVYTNQRLRDFTGHRDERIERADWLKILHPQEVDRNFNLWEEALLERDVWEAECRFRHHSGVYRWFLCRAIRVPGGATYPTQWFGICTDIEDRKRSEQELQRSNQDLQQFAWAASHDLVEPLRMVMIFTQMLQSKLSGKVDETAQEFMGYTVEGAQRIYNLIGGLRLYWEGNEPDVDTPDEVNAGAVLASVLHELQTDHPEATDAVTADTLPVIRAVAPRLASVFYNLLDNALKFHAPGAAPVVHVAATHHEDEWEFIVSDQGVGIAPEYHAQIFKIFRKLSRETPGPGVGLSLAEQAVRHMGGRIWVESQEGRGAAFHFTVPVAK